MPRDIVACTTSSVPQSVAQWLSAEQAPVRPDRDRGCGRGLGIQEAPSSRQHATRVQASTGSTENRPPGKLTKSVERSMSRRVFAPNTARHRLITLSRTGCCHTHAYDGLIVVGRQASGEIGVVFWSRIS